MSSPVKVRQVRDSVDVDRIMGISAFAVVTRVSHDRMSGTVHYDMVTDNEVVHGMQLETEKFEERFPVVYLDDVRFTSYFGKGYASC